MSVNAGVSVEVELIIREDVVNCYRFILGHEPESEDVIDYFVKESGLDQDKLRIAFLNCDEFQQVYQQQGEQQHGCDKG